MTGANQNFEVDREYYQKEFENQSPEKFPADDPLSHSIKQEGENAEGTEYAKNPDFDNAHKMDTLSEMKAEEEESTFHENKKAMNNSESYVLDRSSKPEGEGEEEETEVKEEDEKPESPPKKESPKKGKGKK